ncbi:unnamed protein product [Brassica oleracea var. botrytis]|nr:putative B3 domain-containing protein At2g27410 [Brassica napus]XP_048609972.1 putative B3 domain-containing protein At2g27410 [Brassica napus]KAH0886566.1 hypothetical protein HID58_062662 [Brassica napus]CAF1865262.1 unnamed protein product [Brassica napus]CAF1865304.1 unnamed protein product [Brassica napus]
MVEPQPPKWVLEALRRFNGMEARLVIADKVLYASDVKQSQARLMLPANKVLSKEEFLRDEEIRVLEGDAKATRKEGVQAIFLDPNYITYGVWLKQWKKNLVLSGWNPVLAGYNEFEEGEKFDLWSFRREEKLHFALVPKEVDCGYLDAFSDLDFKTLNDVPSSNDEDCFGLDLLFSTSGYANVNAPLPDLGSFEDTDVVTSFYDDA